MIREPQYVPSIAVLKREGFIGTIKGTSKNGNNWVGYINASTDFEATRLFAKWEHGGTYQVAHKEANTFNWVFRGFGYFEDEAHFLRLLANPNAATEQKDAGSGDAIAKAHETDLTQQP